MLDDFLSEVRRVVRYDPETGVLTWLVKRRSPKDVGRNAGCLSLDGYIALTLFNKKYKAHRVAWLLTYGRWPIGDVDHIDGNRTNNRLSNLREVSRLENLQNVRKPTCVNKVGFLGVSPNKKRFAASIKVNGDKLHLGTFDTPEQAHAAYMDAKVKHHVGYVAL